MGIGLAAKVQSVSEALDLSQEDVGRIVGASGRTVNRWATGSSEPQPSAKERLLELVAVGEALANVIRPEDANLWIFSPNPLLGYDKPAERIRAGDYKSVLGVIDALADGVVT